MKKKDIDIVCVGEALIDLIGEEMADGLATTKTFHKYVGGSPTNVAINMSHLDLRAHHNLFHIGKQINLLSLIKFQLIY